MRLRLYSKTFNVKPIGSGFHNTGSPPRFNNLTTKTNVYRMRQCLSVKILKALYLMKYSTNLNFAKEKAYRKHYSKQRLSVTFSTKVIANVIFRIF